VNFSAKLDFKYIIGWDLLQFSQLMSQIIYFNLDSWVASPKTFVLSFHLIWLSCVKVVWHEKNARVFQQKEVFIHHLKKIKLQSLWWLKMNHSNFAFNYHM